LLFCSEGKLKIKIFEENITNIFGYHGAWLEVLNKGVVCKSEFELVAFIIKPIKELLELNDHSKIIENRINNFAEILTFDSKRINDWYFVKSVLSWIWALDDGCDTHYHEKITQIFYERCY